MTRPRVTMWILFALCALLAATPLAWVTRLSLRLEAGRARAAAEAALNERVRLALWRMDSRLLADVVRESSRPAAHYDGASIAPRLAWARLYFVVTPAGAWSSPETTPARAAKEPGAKALLASLSAATTPQRLWRELGQPLPAPHSPPAAAQTAQQAAAQTQSVLEYNLRLMSNVSASTEDSAAPALRAVWLNCSGAQPILVFVREAGASGQRASARLEGFWADWPDLSASLLDDVRDLLPQARLLPRWGKDPLPPDRALANIPAVIDPGVLPAQPAPEGSFAHVALAAAWAAFALSALIAGLALNSLVSLSERRMEFVSAVTHELRTPLTTLRLYSDMLAGGMVPAERCAEYLQTMRRESDRLSQLVQNVLDHARLERRAWTPAVRPIAVADLIERAAPLLRERCNAAGMTLAISRAEPPDARVRADAEIVERILFNLVDNACKYAARSQDRRVAIAVSAQGRRVYFDVSDAGPGVPPAVARKLFSPFHRGGSLAPPGPGVGLGLALARRWARGLGGRLDLVAHRPPGARFRLTLRAARANPDDAAPWAGRETDAA